MHALAMCIAAAGTWSCAPKVPIRDVGAQFTIADAAWFEEEETLFFFYRVEAIQGLNDTSRIEISYETDEAKIPFTPIAELEPVHRHIDVDCSWNLRCGSWSIHVPQAPRNVQMRLRYHEAGETFLDSPLAYFQVDAGDDHLQRSALLYGVFDENNESVQWRLRHQFPSLRNEEVEALGLRRNFRIRDMRYGYLDRNGAPISGEDFESSGPHSPAFFDNNPYGYGWSAGCPESFTSFPSSAADTWERAVLQAETLPQEASPAPYACAVGEVATPLGWYATSVWAQKNPEVQPAFPLMRTPIQPLTEIRYFFDFCQVEDPSGHREMQQQRLLMEPEHVFCLDGESRSTLRERFRQELSRRIDAERRVGEDLVLYLGLHRSNEQNWVSTSLAQALSAIFETELMRSTPRLAGAFVFDSEPFVVSEEYLSLTTLWCPSFPGIDVQNLVTESPRSCAITPVELPPINVRDVNLGSLPVLPSRTAYENHVEVFGTDYLGEINRIEAKAPVRIAESENVLVGPFSMATFFDDERISAGVDTSFSYCDTEEDTSWNLIFRSRAEGEIRELKALPDWHAENLEAGYDLGLLWDSSFYLEMGYVTIGVVRPDGQSAEFFDEQIDLTVTVPLSPEIPGTLYPFGDQWSTDTFDIRKVLLRCDRFCDHPTFDSVGIYQIRQSFRRDYANGCYAPAYPALWEGGFPLDP